jgi:NADH:ubiquinone oxidoreductase subunit 5 (subunit L)/multisubunit Na+/H+ antiporter MnhA subunit
MKTFLALFVILPFLGFLITLLIPKQKEKTLSQVAFFTAGLQWLSAMLFITYWVYKGAEPLNIKEFSIYKVGDYEFFIDLYFDGISAVYLVVGSFLTFLITSYSRHYLHREKGYKRFFNTILFFYAGYNLTIFSGNFETLFIGWEILGISSFLLIAYYRERYLPVRNAFKVYSIYRLGDAALLLAMWMSHHLWHHNITFLEMNNMLLVDSSLKHHASMGLFISLMILVAAAVKSAQLPFSSWLPRAMEGPTPSSAIFYSSLAVHIGVFILLRTFPFWENQYIIRGIVMALGAITATIATLSAGVQSSIKSQIAYSSVAQIGIMFVEISLGLEVLVLIHFAGNAFLRTYQLLVSPSVVTYLIRDQFYNYLPSEPSTDKKWLTKWKYTIYVASVREWNLDSFLFRYFWNPLKIIGKQFSFLNNSILFGVIMPLFFGFTILWRNETWIPTVIRAYLPILIAIIGLLLVMRAFVERKRVLWSWTLILLNHFWMALAISFNESFTLWDIVIYLSGATVASIIGFICLLKLRKAEKSFSLNLFQGHVYEYPVLGGVFLLACLGVAGFPITSTFLGQDLIFSHIQEDQFILAFLVSLSFIINGLATIRIYIRIFLGPHVKTNHEVAYRSA